MPLRVSSCCISMPPLLHRAWLKSVKRTNPSAMLCVQPHAIHGKFWDRTRQPSTSGEDANVTHLLRKLWLHEEGQDIAEYAVMLAVILILVIGTVRLVGGNANNTFSTVASSIQ
jgi:Flp pilus assembly pilin Flp